jgi:stage II sporulation protein D
MSQWGAQGMALTGASYQQILAHYYQGTALTAVGGD